jgi:hypothetical protein
MRKFVTSLGFAAIFTALGRFLSAPLLLAERADATTGILFAAGLFTVAIAAVVRKGAVERASSVFFYGAERTS